MPLPLRPKTQSEIDARKAVLSLRWLVVILASYLTLFSYIGTEQFPLVFGIALVFSLTNILLMLIPRKRFTATRIQTGIAVLDLAFVSLTLYLLRVPGNYLFLGFLAIFILAVLWRDLRLVLVSLFVVSLLFGAFSYFRFFGFQAEVNVERFLTMSLFFVVAIFYIFLWERLMQDAKTTNSMMEENRIAEAMVEMTRTLSSSLNSDEVLLSIVTRLSEVLEAEDCFIVRVDSKTGLARVLVKASQPDKRNLDINMEDHPELKQAQEARRLLFMPDAKPFGIIAIPMIAHESVLGLIDVRSARLPPVLSSANARFFEVMASTAANALRNAQLFEEVEHRARTDFLTGLPNHRFFQATLSVELGRAQRHNHPLSLLIVDLDYLKEVNDRFGHPSGDMVIRTIAAAIRTSCREIDFAARYGGEEFTVILPETPLAGAIQVADRIRDRISAEQFPGIGNITASVGVSNYPINALSKEDLIRVADQALYIAKNGGRDRVAYFNYQMITR
ncbi:MAG TPA: sensor domain-containing diguanylate cyclase [Terriglobia bacterium]|jgi:diguanylate cyclase (GGDEF)-like protein